AATMNAPLARAVDATMMPATMRSHTKGGLLVVALALAPLSAWADGVATLASTRGDVRVRASGSKDYLKAAKGARLGDGARVRTEADGEAELEYGDGSKVTIRPSSEVIVRPRAAKEERPNGVVLL